MSSPFLNRVQSGDTTLYKEYTEHVFNRYIVAAKFLMGVKPSDCHAIISARTEYAACVSELRAVLRADDPRLNYIP